MSLKRRKWNFLHLILDGKYSNVLLSDVGFGDKIMKQRKEIDKFLKNKPDNYWLNTAGFEKFISDLK